LSLDAKRELIEPAHPQISMARQCALLGVPRATYYDQAQGESSENLQWMRLRDAQYTQRPSYGTRRMTAWLQSPGSVVNRKRVTRRLRTMGLETIYPQPPTSQRHPAHRVYPYLLRGVALTRGNQVWSPDSTYIRLPSGFVYLVALMDWFSRSVLSWALSITMAVGFCLEALEHALGVAPPETFNSAQGAQFPSLDFPGRLESAGSRMSLDGRGRALDNVFVERLWRTVQYEET
jgi:putative transposase